LLPYRRFRPRSRAAWRQWLTDHHASSPGVLIVFAKKHTGLATVSYNDAVEEALCFGWIDTTLNPIDDTFYAQLFTPRKPRSTWAASNKARVERLIAAGLMTDAGLAAIAVAKENGSWTTIDHVEALTPPADLQKALRATKAAATNWEGYSPSCRKQFLYWLARVKGAETRAARIAEIVACSKTGLTYGEYSRKAAEQRARASAVPSHKTTRRTGARRRPRS
jgi:uncharacterized protein YdeI (YjbR/CyaY-like superfamily)